MTILDPGDFAHRRRGGKAGGRKGPPDPDDAWPVVLAAHPEAWLLVVGEGSERNSLEGQAASLGIAEHIVFTGRREDVPAVTAALDVAVLPSYRRRRASAFWRPWL